MASLQVPFRLAEMTSSLLPPKPTFWWQTVKLDTTHQTHVPMSSSHIYKYKDNQIAHNAEIVLGEVAGVFEMAPPLFWHLPDISLRVVSINFVSVYSLFSHAMERYTTKTKGHELRNWSASTLSMKRDISLCHFQRRLWYYADRPTHVFSLTSFSKWSKFLLTRGFFRCCCQNLHSRIQSSLKGLLERKAKSDGAYGIL